MKKEFEYRGIKFEINVDLNTRVERRPDGDRWHTVNTYSLTDGIVYRVRDEVKDKHLITYLQDCEPLAKKYVDEKIDNIQLDYEQLSKLGFKEVNN